MENELLQSGGMVAAIIGAQWFMIKFFAKREFDSILKRLKNIELSYYGDPENPMNSPGMVFEFRSLCQNQEKILHKLGQIEHTVANFEKSLDAKIDSHKCECPARQIVERKIQEKIDL